MLSSLNRCRRETPLLVGLLTLVLLTLPTTQTTAGVLIEPINPPDWQVSEWINGNPGSIAKNHDKLIIIEFFQMWCPGCNEFSIPLMQRWNDRYGKRSDVLLFSIHTVFEGHDVQTTERLREFVRGKGIRHPVGIDAYDSDDPITPVTMKRYRTGGTPHIVIIDKNSKLVFSHFGRFDVRTVEGFIDRKLLEESVSNDGFPTLREDDTFTRPPINPLSGRYELTLEQVSNSCSSRIPIRQTKLRLALVGNQLEATFDGNYMGYDKLMLDYNPTAQSFSLDSRTQLHGNGAALILQLEVTGFLLDGSTPRFQFSAILNQGGPGTGPECLIELRGHGSRIGA